MEPHAEQLPLPTAYGRPDVLLDWAEVQARLEAAPHYWLATVRPDGRPHAVPVDGIWVDGALVFGGDPATVHARNLAAGSGVSVHLGNADEVTILEGVPDLYEPSQPEARAFAAASKAKYGYAPPVSAYLSGVWRVRPTVVLAWTALHRDATRFRFGPSAPASA